MLSQSFINQTIKYKKQGSSFKNIKICLYLNFVSPKLTESPKINIHCILPARPKCFCRAKNNRFVKGKKQNRDRFFPKRIKPDWSFGTLCQH